MKKKSPIIEEEESDFVFDFFKNIFKWILDSIKSVLKVGCGCLIIFFFVIPLTLYLLGFMNFFSDPIIEIIDIVSKWFS
jgi:hypothetical protein